MAKVKNFVHIRVEQLEVKSMKETAPSRGLRRDIAKTSWNIEKYKSEKYGKVFEEILEYDKWLQEQKARWDSHHTESLKG